MKMHLKHSLAYLAALCGTLGIAWAAHADWFYDFQTAPPASFVMASGPPSGTFLSTAAVGVLQFSDTLLPADGGARLGFGEETSQIFTDVRVTGTLNPAGTTTNQLNLKARTDPQVVTTGYAAGINFDAGTLQVTKLVGQPIKIVLSTDDSQGNQPPLTDRARGYFLQFDVVGNQLTARVFDVQGGTQLLVVNYTDTGDGGPPFTSGVAGVTAVSTTGGLVDATFGPVGATAIPGWFYDFQTAPPASFITQSATSSGTLFSTAADGVLRLSDTRLPSDGGAPLAFALETSMAFSDVRVTGTLNPTGSSDNILNLLARNDAQAMNTYGAGIDFVTGVLRIAKVIGGGAPVEVVSSTDDSQGNQPLLTDLARSYFWQLDVVGNSLTATVFDVEGGTQLLVVTYTDTGVGGPALESGLVGASSVSNRGLTTLLDGNFGPIRAAAILP
jgi:hypothetical protein